MIGCLFFLCEKNVSEMCIIEDDVVQSGPVMLIIESLKTRSSISRCVAYPDVKLRRKA